jgi:hypothetical protein
MVNRGWLNDHVSLITLLRCMHAYLGLPTPVQWDVNEAPQMITSPLQQCLLSRVKFAMNPYSNSSTEPTLGDAHFGIFCLCLQSCCRNCTADKKPCFKTGFRGKKLYISLLVLHKHSLRLGKVSLLVPRHLYIALFAC